MTLARRRARCGIMFKDLCRACLDEAAQRAKPAFLHDPLREIEVYRDLLDGAGLGTPAYYGSAVDPAARPLLAVHRERRGRRCCGRSASSRSGRRRRAGWHGMHAALAPAAAAAAASCCATTRPATAPGSTARASSRDDAARRRGTTRRSAVGWPRRPLRAGRRAARGAAGHDHPRRVLSIQRARPGTRPARPDRPDRLGDRRRRPGPARPGGAHDRQMDRRRSGPRSPRAYREAAEAGPGAEALPPTSTRRSTAAGCTWRSRARLGPRLAAARGAPPRLARRVAADRRRVAPLRVERCMTTSQTDTSRRVLEVLRFAVPWDASVAVVGQRGGGHRAAGRDAARAGRR